jgi:hydrogenase small subunit
MELSRRDLLKASSAVAAALGLDVSGFLGVEEAFAKNGAQGVIWLQGQGCTGDSVSLLNTIYYMTIDGLLLNTIDLKYHPNLSAAAGDLAVQAINNAATKNFILVVEGAIPTGAYASACSIATGWTMADAVTQLAAKTPFVIAVGTCACYGGLSAGAPNPTGAKSVQAHLGRTRKVLSIPGCPANPDWIVGTIAYMLKYGFVPREDANNRPTDYFGKTVHSACPFNSTYAAGPWATAPGQNACKRMIGCRGPVTYSDCPTRKWNAGSANTYGVNWCVQSGTPCLGCTQPTFPDAMTPMYVLGSLAATGKPTTSGGSTGGTVNCSQCHSDGRTGSLPAGHPPVAGSTGGTTGGGTTGTINCAQCHSDGRTGPLPAGHPAVSTTSTGGTTTGGTTSGGSSSNDD